MNSQRIIEAWGAITKEEKVRSIRLNSLNNFLVLENIEPFPGYFGENLPTGTRPRSIFLILAKKYKAEDLMRTLKRVSQKIQHKCYGCFGYIQMYNHKNYCIRIKNLDCFDTINTLQSYLQEEGIEFMKHKGLTENALIKVYKPFLISEAESGKYEDQLEEDKVYLRYPYHVSWNDFKEITQRVRYNLSNNLFDAALCTIWNLNGPTDLIRLFDRRRNSLRTNLIHQLYLRETKVWIKENYKEDIIDTANKSHFYIS